MKKQLVLSQDFQNSTDYSIILFQYLSENYNIVQVYYHNEFHYEIPKDAIHHSLESSQTVSYTKKYHQEFEKSVICIEDCFLLVARLDIDIVETSAYI